MITTFRTRCTVICAALIAIAAMFAASPVRAQDDDFSNCRCRYITVVVENGVRCNVEFCIGSLDQDVELKCITIGPGGSTLIPCQPRQAFYIRDCHGQDVLLHPGRFCDLGIGAGPNCCTVDVCYSRTDAGCPLITIRPSILDVCPCL